MPTEIDSFCQIYSKNTKRKRNNNKSNDKSKEEHSSNSEAEYNNNKKIKECPIVILSPFVTNISAIPIKKELHIISKRKEDSNKLLRGVLNLIKQNDDLIFVSTAEYTIFQIDAIIKERLKAKILLKDKMTELLKEILSRRDFNCEPNYPADSLISFLRKKIQDAETTFEYGVYLLKTSDIIERSKKVFLSELSQNFVCINNNESLVESKERNDLLLSFLAIAKDYVCVDGPQKRDLKLVCSFCEGDFLCKSDDETTLVCQNKACGAIMTVLDDSPTFKDTDRVNMASRYTYSRKGHFIEAMKKYQGKHTINAKILQDVREKLEYEMNLHNLTKYTVTKNQLYTFMSENKLSRHYDDINILFYIITGNLCPDLSLLEDKLLELFEHQENALDTVSSQDRINTRVNSINVYYKLYKLLQKLRYPCKKSDFFILKTKAKEDEHDEKMKLAWKYLGWRWIETN